MVRTFCPECGTSIGYADECIPDELYVTDGPAVGTALVKDIHPGPGSSFPGAFHAVGATVYFSASDGRLHARGGSPT